MLAYLAMMAPRLTGAARSRTATSATRKKATRER